MSGGVVYYLSINMIEAAINIQPGPVGRTLNLFAHARMTRKAVKILVLLVNHLTCLSFLTSYPSFLL